MVKAPYDARNQLDYCEMTEKIESALDKLRRDVSIPATESSLARLAGCSRNTLRNRKHPIKQLKEIKSSRSMRESRNSSHVAPMHSSSESVHIEENKVLLLQLSQSREEITVWVNKYFSLETENKRLQRHNELLYHGRKALELQLEKALSNEAGANDSSHR